MDIQNNNKSDETKEHPINNQRKTNVIENHKDIKSNNVNQSIKRKNNENDSNKKEIIKKRKVDSNNNESISNNDNSLNRLENCIATLCNKFTGFEDKLDNINNRVKKNEQHISTLIKYNKNYISSNKRKKETK